MKHILENLQALIGSRKIVHLHGSRVETARSVVMRVTLDARHATPLRQALIRDCAGQPWTIRVTPLRGTDRVRLVLYLPRSALTDAMQHVTRLAADGRGPALPRIGSTSAS